MSPRARRALAVAGAGLLAAAAPASAQMYHLYLACQGELAAGPGAQSPADAGLVARSGSGGAAPAVAERNLDKNSPEADENLQPRARAVRSAAKRGNAHLDLALRDNNMSMLVQRSNVLPTGERLRYEASQTHYTANYLPNAGGVGYREWREGWLFGWYPPFQKMRAARFAIDRQTGVLQGEIVGAEGEVLGLIDMQCEPKKDEDQPKPRF